MDMRREGLSGTPAEALAGYYSTRMLVDAMDSKIAQGWIDSGYYRVLTPEAFSHHNFAGTSYVDLRGNTQRRILMTQEGFTRPKSGYGLNGGWGKC